MAVLNKQGGRKPVVVGSLNVGYANFFEFGLNNPKHLKVRIDDIESDYKPHTISMTFQEAENLLTYLGYYLVGHGDLTIDDLVCRINKKLEADKNKFQFGTKKESQKPWIMNNAEMYARKVKDLAASNASNRALAEALRKAEQFINNNGLRDKYISAKNSERKEHDTGQS